MFKIKVLTLTVFCGTVLFISNIAIIKAESLNNQTPDQIIASRVYYCPSISEMSRMDFWWTARNGSWKSYSQSLSKEIETFVGAQWFGVNVGKIICIYHGKGGFDFPIALEQSKNLIVPEPSHPNWITQRAGYKLCQSTNVTDCPFPPQTAEDNTNPYDKIHYQYDPKNREQ